MAKPGVFIGCLPGDTDERELLDLLKSFAKVTSIKLARGRNQTAAGFCQGYGFVLCPSRRDAETLLAVENLSYRGRQLVLKPFRSGACLKADKQTLRRKRLFVGKVPQHLAEEDLRPVFEQFGQLEAFYFVEQSKSMKFKYGYAVYCNSTHAIKAVGQLSQSKMLPPGLRVEFCGRIQTAPLTKKSGSFTDYSDGKSQTEQNVSLLELLTLPAAKPPNSVDCFTTKSKMKRRIQLEVGNSNINESVHHNRALDKIRSPRGKDSHMRDALHYSENKWESKTTFDHSENNIRLNLAKVLRNHHQKP